MADNQSLEVLRLGASGEIVLHRVDRVNKAVESMGRALQNQVIRTQQAYQGPLPKYDQPDMWEAGANHPVVPASPEVRSYAERQQQMPGATITPEMPTYSQPKVIPPSAEVVNYAQTVGGNAETTPTVQQAQSQVISAYDNAPQQELNYDI